MKSKIFKEDFSPIEEGCTCSTCTTVSRAYIHSLVSNKQAAGCHLITVHNVAFQLNLMRDIRSSIKEDKYPEFIKTFLLQNYPGGVSTYPKWTINALKSVGISIQ
jgi:queuine tRNA-ribosyltransferase